LNSFILIVQILGKLRKACNNRGPKHRQILLLTQRQ